MLRKSIDHDHLKSGGARLGRYSKLDRMMAGEGAHPKVKMLVRRPKRGVRSMRLKQFLRIDRGHIA